MGRVDRILDDLVGEVEAGWDAQFDAQVAQFNARVAAHPGYGIRTLNSAGVSSPGTPHVVATTNCRNCGAPPSVGVGTCRYCGTPHSVTTPTTRDRTAPRRTLD